MTAVWAHRGASAYAPENTMEAFRLAQKMGADGIELDVHLTCDGEILVTHDENVRRVTGVDAQVSSLTLAQAQALDACNGMEAYRGARLPALCEVLDFLKGNGMTLNIELKTGEVLYPGLEEKTVEMVHRFGLADRVLYSSFNHYSLVLVREVDPQAKIGLLYSEAMVDPALYAQHLRADAIHPEYRTLAVPGAVEGCKRANVRIHPWTVNAEADMRALCGIPCEAIITNHPDIARRVVDETRKA